jgi:glutamine amidotransferase
MAKVVVADFGTGNLRSVAKAVAHVAGEGSVSIADTAQDISRAERLILPGQGAIGTWMRRLESAGLAEAVDHALARVPVLGVCLGLHALFAHSAESGGTTGLNRLSGHVCRFGDAFELGTAQKIPHMGWNEVRHSQAHPLWQGIDDETRFYFVHSYHVAGADEHQVVGTTEYGSRFVSACASDNLFATQFHPEKSGRAGLRLIANFLEWDGRWNR